MNIRSTSHFKVFLIISLSVLPLWHKIAGQVTCNDPITLSSILISNATCNNSTGTIILNLSSGAYQFNWTPSVSVSNVASNLQAGTYEVEVVRADNPNCRLDTTIIVNNSNGPLVQVSSITPANCMAANGKVVLAPTALTYTWSNGETGATNDGLASGCYYVTATNASGCYSTLKVCVPNTNPLETNVVVLQNAKCGLPTGAVNVIVEGGSGQYQYTLGSAPPFTNLAANLYFCGIADVVTGCTDEVSFIIEDIPVSASVELMPVNVQCPGGGNGSIGITLTPGDNFSLPYTTVIRNASGMQVMPSQLQPGTYTIQINDATGCPLPLDTFVIQTPALFLSQSLIIPGDCETGGQILLSISGGTGPKRVDWLDLPGGDNPKDRTDLNPGIYSAIIYDSLSCSFSVNPTLVTSDCIGIDTIPLNVNINSSATYCMNLPVGVLPGDALFSIPGNGSNSGSSSFGSWILEPDGCLVYTAGSSQGIGVDTICIARGGSLTALDDTICLIVNIGQQVCGPIHNYTPDMTGTIVWKIASCTGDTIFCSTIPTSELGAWSITDNFLLVGNIADCGSFAGIRLDTGLHELRIQNAGTACYYDVRVLITCDEVTMPVDTTYAVADAVITQRGDAVEIPLLANDVIQGTLGNIGAVSAVTFLSAPVEGQYNYNSTAGILIYMPADNQCGPVSFTYQLTDTLGLQSQTTITITVICDKILIYNGISPNGDSLNDVWHLPGIDQYENNEVRVFNRWGNLVFERKGYTNAQAWDGKWNGRDLPDGTYFYTIDLRDGSAVLSGYLQIMR